ncbi:MAG: nucleotide sugar dehydrogenase [Elusimicrobia bacterium]|nr:nucleotide sugar dehydrogenase [Candidatus Obscuribacterium magneticum]
MQNLTRRINTNEARIGIVGLGYVGLPLAVEFAKANFPVTGFEVDGHKVSSLKRGDSYIKDVPSESLQTLIKSKKLTAISNFDLLHKMDAVIICVPTPLRKTKDPDISYIVSALEKVEKNLRKGQLIILESTTYPGTTREILLPVLEKGKLKVGRDFFLAFSPERVDPGNANYGIKNTPKIVGGITSRCTELAKILYARIAEKVVPVSSTESAEMVKLLENTFRAVNIGLVNEVALMCDRLKLNCWEVIDAAATKPFGFMPFYPGPGIGGHCIPLDPHYLSWKLKSLNFYSRFIELAGEINSKMPEYLVSKIGDALNDQGKSIKGAKILIVGVAYKKDIEDVRESPALDVIELIHKKGAKLSYHDPYVAQIKVEGTALKSVPLSNELLKTRDCVVITTNHSCLNIQQIVDSSRLVVDSRNATKGFHSKNIVKL